LVTRPAGAAAGALVVRCYGAAAWPEPFRLTWLAWARAGTPLRGAKRLRGFARGKFSPREGGRVAAELGIWKGGRSGSQLSAERGGHEGERAMGNAAGKPPWKRHGRVENSNDDPEGPPKKHKRRQRKSKKSKAKRKKNVRRRQGAIGVSPNSPDDHSADGTWRIRNLNGLAHSEVYFDAEEALSGDESDYSDDLDGGSDDYWNQLCLSYVGTLGNWGSMFGGIYRFLTLQPQNTTAEAGQVRVNRQWNSSFRDASRPLRQVAKVPTPAGAGRRKASMSYEQSVEEGKKEDTECWDEPGPCFYLRGKTYLQDRVKVKTEGVPVYKLDRVEVYTSEEKIDHIAERLNLPSTENIPRNCPISPMLVVNWQVPMYPAKLFGQHNGPGLNAVAMYTLRDDFCAEKEIEEGRLLPGTFELLKKFCEDAIEENGVPFRDRLKLVPTVPNLEEWCVDGGFNKTEQKLLARYHRKPLLARPQVSYFVGVDYIEVDINVHQYIYLTRRYFHALRPALKHAVMDMALTLEGRNSAELPEEVIAAIRFQKIDFFAEFPKAPPLLSGGEESEAEATSTQPPIAAQT